jgi:protein-L-isoaspartate(D-aspartate) O-methyltransferase
LGAGLQGGETGPEALARDRMVEELAQAEGIRDRRVLEAMRAVPRQEFVGRKWRRWACADMALPIGHGQTLTPPSLVAYMTEQLELGAQHRVLEVGTGCGYQAAILGRLVREVYSVEIVGALGRQAQKNLRRLAVGNVVVRIGDGYQGWPEQAPFDRILVTCSPEQVPEPLLAQLAEGGRMLIPVGGPYGQTLCRFTKAGGQVVREALAPTVFVPMTGAADAVRTLRADPAHPALVDGAFEQVDPATGQLSAWYHQRQLVREPVSGVPGGGPCVTFRNDEPGRAAQAAQALPLDGRRVRALRLAGWVRTQAVQTRLGKPQIATVAVAFYDADRAILKQGNVGDWRGTLAWQPFEGTIAVPRGAREAVVQLGLHGATGSVSFGRLQLVAIERQPAR